MWGLGPQNNVSTEKHRVPFQPQPRKYGKLNDDTYFCTSRWRRREFDNVMGFYQGCAKCGAHYRNECHQ